MMLCCQPSLAPGLLYRGSWTFHNWGKHPAHCLSRTTHFNPLRPVMAAPPPCLPPTPG